MDSLFIYLFFQAKDKAHWQKLFSHFCSRTANEEEELAHKLLGEQFRVSYLHVLDLKVAEVWTFQICQFETHNSALLRSLGKEVQFDNSLREFKAPAAAVSACDVDFLCVLCAGAAGLVTQPFYCSTLWRPSQSGELIRYVHVYSLALMHSKNRFNLTNSSLFLTICSFYWFIFGLSQLVQT